MVEKLKIKNSFPFVQSQCQLFGCQGKSAFTHVSSLLYVMHCTKCFNDQLGTSPHLTYFDPLTQQEPRMKLITSGIVQWNLKMDLKSRQKPKYRVKTKENQNSIYKRAKKAIRSHMKKKTNTPQSTPVLSLDSLQENDLIDYYISNFDENDESSSEPSQSQQPSEEPAVVQEAILVDIDDPSPPVNIDNRENSVQVTPPSSLPQILSQDEIHTTVLPDCGFLNMMEIIFDIFLDSFSFDQNVAFPLYLTFKVKIAYSQVLAEKLILPSTAVLTFLVRYTSLQVIKIRSVIPLSRSLTTRENFFDLKSLLQSTLYLDTTCRDSSGQICHLQNFKAKIFVSCYEKNTPLMNQQMQRIHDIQQRNKKLEADIQANLDLAYREFIQAYEYQKENRQTYNEKKPSFVSKNYADDEYSASELSSASLTESQFKTSSNGLSHDSPRHSLISRRNTVGEENEQSKTHFNETTHTRSIQNHHDWEVLEPPSKEEIQKAYSTKFQKALHIY